jgi:hypothetical protein
MLLVRFHSILARSAVSVDFKPVIDYCKILEFDVQQ